MAVKTEDEFKALLEEQTPGMRTLIAARAAARVVVLVDTSKSKEIYGLLTGRAVLTSTVMAKMPTAEIRNAANGVGTAASSTAGEATSRYAAHVASFAVGAAGAAAYGKGSNATDSAANAAGYAARRVAHAAVTSALRREAGDAAQAAARSAVFSASYGDSERDFDELLDATLWPEGREPDWLQGAVKEGGYWQTGAAFDFWRRWYRGMLMGQPLDWELQRRVALIDNDIWEAGPGAVAEEIARIEDELKAQRRDQEARHPEFEPGSVDALFKNKVVTGAQALQLGQQIEQSIARFHAETGLNQLPEAFQPLERMPRALTRISAVLTHEAQSPEAEQRLREEIGRLSARVAELEKELAVAKAKGEPIFAPAFKEQAGKSLGDWKLYAALCASLWVVTGDTAGMRTRLENLMGLREALFGDVCPTPQVPPSAPSNPIVDV